MDTPERYATDIPPGAVRLLAPSAGRIASKAVGGLPPGSMPARPAARTARTA